MKDIIDEYIDISKKHLNTILINLESNIEFLDNNLWKDSNEFKNLVADIVNIYYDKYYLYNSNDFKIIDKYIKFNNKINRKLKTIILSIIEYFEKNQIENKIEKDEESILYLTILIYLSLILYEKDYNLIDTPKKIEKEINNVIDNFRDIRFKREKNLFDLINNIKDIIISNNNFNKLINKLNTKDSHNYFIKINNKLNLYKVIYEYDIKELNDYNELDINIVNNKINITNILNGISYDLAYFTAFKMLKNGINNILLFKISKEEILNDKILDYMTKRNKKINDNIKFLIDYEDIKNNYELVNKIKDKGIDIYIEINKVIETDNYNMFMDINNVIVPEEFLSLNEKYVEIWKDMNMNFIIKDLKDKVEEKNLLIRK